MRNLKKILALALALVMTLSLMTVANATAFEDDADISETYSEAVTVLSNLGVFKGVNDGSNFAPKQTISRGEVAAIIYRIVTGDVTNANIEQHAAYAAQAFADVKATDWDAGYIGYCANAQIIVGDGTNFYPRASVTGYQALAMILRAIGYDANDEFQGNGWEIRTASTAQQLGLLKNIGASSLNNAATREMVAEILFRTIAEAYVVKYTTAFGYQPVYLPTSENQTDVLAGDRITLTLGYQQFGLEKQTGEITAVGRTAGTTTLGNWETQTGLFNREYYVFDEDQVTVANTNTPWTDIGYGAYVYTVPTSGSKNLTAVSDVVITGESLLTSTDGTAHEALEAANTGKVTVDSPYNVYLNGGRQTTDAARAEALDEAVNRGVKIDYIDNDNGGKAEAIVITSYTAARVSAVTTADTTTGAQGVKETTTYLNNGIVARVAVADSKLVTSDTLAVGDWVTYVEYANDYYVTEAPATTAVMTARSVSANADTVYTIGGTGYYVSDLEYVTGSPVINAASTYLNGVRLYSNMGTSVSIYTDPYGYIVYADEYVPASNYLYVLSNEHTNANTKLTEAVVALADGTIATVNVTKQAGSSIFTDDGLVGMWDYTVDASGNYVLDDLQTQMTNGTYTTGTATFAGTVGGTATSVAVDTATVVVDLRSYRVGDTSATVYTGYSQIPTVQRATLWYADTYNGLGTGRTINVAFLLNNSNDVVKDFIVYQTTDYDVNVDVTTNNRVSYDMDVVIGGALVADYELTPAEFAEVQTYGVGLYRFVNGVLIDYSAFNEVDGWTSTWGNGRISVRYDNAEFGGQSGTVHYTYANDSQITVLNIGVGINNFGLLTGSNFRVYVEAAGTAAQHIYIIEDTENVSSIFNVEKTLDKGGYRYTYLVNKNNSGAQSTRGDDITICTGRVLLDGTYQPTVTKDDYELKFVQTLELPDDTTFTTTVPYSVWSEWDEDEDAYTVTPAAHNEISIDGKDTFSEKAVTVAVDLPATSEANKEGYAGSQTIEVYSQSTLDGEVSEKYTFIIYYLPDTTGTNLLIGKTAQAGLSVYDGDDKATIEDLIGSDREGGYYTHDGASWKWTFISGNGNEVSALGTSVGDLARAEVTVTAADGATAKYVISFANVTADIVKKRVDPLSKDDTLTPQKIADLVWTASGDNKVGDGASIPAMLKAGVTPEEIFKSMVSSTKTAPVLAGHMDGAVSDNAILMGYFDAEAVNGVLTVVDGDDALKVTRNGNTFTVTVPEGSTEEITGTGLGTVAAKLGITAVDEYSTTDGTTTYPKTGDDLNIGKVKGDINDYLVAGAAGGKNWTATIKLGDVTYTVNFVPGE